MFGRSHSDETKSKISTAKSGKNHTEETKRKISLSKLGLTPNNASAVVLLDSNKNLILEFATLKACAEFLSVSVATVYNYKISGKLFRNTYYIVQKS